ncbi:GntR family transcriptional regulator [Streptomyces albulus]|nr:GntR family transcriptional regulator [Streptomyces noursei]
MSAASRHNGCHDTVEADRRPRVRPRPGAPPDGRYPGGELLSERAVATELGLSNTPVREAFLRLQAEGFLRLYPKRGALVVPVTPGEAHAVLQARLLMELFALDASRRAVRRRCARPPRRCRRPRTTHRTAPRPGWRWTSPAPSTPSSCGPVATPSWRGSTRTLGPADPHRGGLDGGPRPCCRRPRRARRHHRGYPPRRRHRRPRTLTRHVAAVLHRIGLAGGSALLPPVA